jgi:hypothetical protein
VLGSSSNALSVKWRSQRPTLTHPGRSRDLPRSLHLPIDVTEGNRTENFNEIGVRLWTDVGASGRSAGANARSERTVKMRRLMISATTLRRTRPAIDQSCRPEPKSNTVADSYNRAMVLSTHVTRRTCLTAGASLLGVAVTRGQTPGPPASSRTRLILLGTAEVRRRK